MVRIIVVLLLVVVSALPAVADGYAEADSGAVERWLADNDKRWKYVQQRQEVTPAAPVAADRSLADLKKAVLEAWYEKNRAEEKWWEAGERHKEHKLLHPLKKVEGARLWKEEALLYEEYKKCERIWNERKREYQEAQRRVQEWQRREYRPDVWLYLKIAPLLLLSGYCFYRAARS